MISLVTLSNKEIGNRIREARLKKNLSVSRLADDVYCSREHLSHIERGDRGLSIDLLASISERLEITTDYILFGEDAYTKELEDEYDMNNKYVMYI